MNREQLGVYLEKNRQVEWKEDEDGNIYLRHSVFDTDGTKLKIEPKALPELTEAKLDKVLVGGRNVEHITRVTGYFSRVSGWNKGKRGELVDRERVRFA